MTKKEIKVANLLVHYKLLEEQKNEIEERQAKLKEMIGSHMEKEGLEMFESNGLVATYAQRNTYVFDVEKIVKAVPEAVGLLKMTNDAFEKLYKGNEQLIGSFRQLKKQDRVLVIRKASEKK